jgi:hypothetical protein
VWTKACSLSGQEERKIVFLSRLKSWHSTESKLKL